MGGTIDGEPYPETEGEYPINVTPSDKNAAFEALKEIHNRNDYADAVRLHIEHIPICNKDSKDIDKQDIQSLQTLIAEHAQNFERIVVTMGTDCMTKISQHIRAQTVGQNTPPQCPVVFTGSIWPLANGPEKSDGYRNLDVAGFTYDTRLTPDIYIATETVFAPAHLVKKNFDAGNSYFYFDKIAFETGMN